jgi:hypothetical protein
MRQNGSKQNLVELIAILHEKKLIDKAEIKERIAKAIEKQNEKAKMKK